MEVDKIGEELVEDPETKLPLLLVTINVLFSTLEASIGHLHATRQVYINKVFCFCLFRLCFHLCILLPLISMIHDLPKQNRSMFADKYCF